MRLCVLPPSLAAPELHHSTYGRDAQSKFMVRSRAIDIDLSVPPCGFKEIGDSAMVDYNFGVHIEEIVGSGSVFTGEGPKWDCSSDW